MKACVIIPSYNVERTIGELIATIKKMGLDVVVVNDGSTDNTADVSMKEGAFVINHAKNLGKGKSLRDGFDHFLKYDYDFVITMDGDGQHDPLDLYSFINQAGASGASLLIGNRMLDPKGMPFVRKATNAFMSFILSKIAKTHIPDTQCGFRLIKRKLLKELSLKTARFEIESEIVIQTARGGFLIESVPVKTVYRSEESKIKPIRDTMRFLRFLFSVNAPRD